MYKNKKIVVVMPAYNAEQTLREAYDEVIAQGVADTIVIVDDCSKDGTEAVAKSLVPGALCLVPGAGGMPGALCLVPGAGENAPSTKHQVPSTKHQAPSTLHHRTSFPGRVGANGSGGSSVAPLPSPLIRLFAAAYQRSSS